MFEQLVADGAFTNAVVSEVQPLNIYVAPVAAGISSSIDVSDLQPYSIYVASTTFDKS